MDGTVYGGDYLGRRGSLTISSLCCTHNLGSIASGTQNQINIDEGYLTFVLKMTPLLFEYFKCKLMCACKAGAVRLMQSYVKS